MSCFKCCKRQTSLYLASVFSLLQSCIGIVVASLAISLYFCAPLMPTFTKEVFSDTVNNVWLKFIYVYFYGSKTMEQCYMQRNVTQPGLKLVEPYQYVLSKNSITSPESTDKYFIGYVAANVIWLAVSIIHLYATSRKKPQLYIPWIIVTLGVCLFDIALLAIYCVDLAVTVDNLVKSPNSPDWSLFTVSVLLPLYFSRGCFIGWALNLTFAVHSMQEASCCGKIEDDKVPLQQPPMSRYHDPSNREHPDLIPTLDRQHVNQQKELGNSNLYRASNAGLPQLNYYPQQQHQRAGSTSSSQPFQTGSLRYDPQKNMAGLPLVSMRNSPRLLRPEPPVEEKRYLPRATYEASEKPVKAGNKISTEGMVQLGAPHSEYQDPQPSIPSQQGDGEFRYQRPWSYLRPNQPFTKPYENHSDKLEEEEFSPVSPYGKIYLSDNEVDLLKDHRFEYTRQGTVEGHYDVPVSQRSTLTVYESSPETEAYEALPFLGRKYSAVYASCPIMNDDYAITKKSSKSELVLNTKSVAAKKKVQFSNYFLNHNSGKSHEYSQVPGVSSENIYEAVNYGAGNKNRGNSQLCVNEFVVQNWSLGTPEKMKLSVTDLDGPSPEKIFTCKGNNHIPPCNGKICRFLRVNDESSV